MLAFCDYLSENHVCSAQDIFQVPRVLVTESLRALEIQVDTATIAVLHRFKKAGVMSGHQQIYTHFTPPKGNSCKAD